MDPATRIERRAVPPVSEFRRAFADASRPVVITGAFDSWRALERWTLDWFRAEHGDCEVPVQVTEGNLDLARVRFRTMRLGDYVDTLKGNEPCTSHLSGHALLRDRPALWADIRIPPYVGALGDDQPFVFFSRVGALTPLHHDLCHNLFVQIRGRKHFTLFSPSQRHALHAPPLWSSRAWTSPVDFESPDLARHPRARRAKPSSVVLEPGQALLIPGGHWHGVRTLEPSIALGFFWEHGLRQRLVRRALRVVGRPAT